MAVQTMGRKTIEYQDFEILKYGGSHDHELTDSVVIDASTVAADAQGVKTLRKGSLIVKITATGEWGPYASAATDGRQTLAAPATGGPPTVAILNQDLDLTDGGKAAGMYFSGAEFDTSKLTLFGASLSAVKTAMPTCWFM